jgi:hypothetical protein
VSCESTQRQLTAYLDGDLGAADGSAVRGHLRECAACRQVASDEGKLRDHLRLLPPVDPPASLWAGVQAQLAAAEVADAKRPAWRRALARWMPTMPTFAAGGLVAAAAIGVVWWRTHRAPADEALATKDPVIAPAPAEPKKHVEPPAPTSPAGDITADLAGEKARITASYGDAAEELLALAGEARAQWTVDQKDAFDAKVAELHGLIDRAPAGREQQRAWRDLIKYLRGAVVRDDVTLAGGGQ